MKIRKRSYSLALSVVANILVVYAAYFVCRLVYIADNWSVFSATISWQAVWNILRGGFLFDSSAIVYTNALYMVLMLLPFTFVLRSGWQRAMRVLFVAVNAVALALNLMDTVYFAYTGRRTTATIFSEFGNEGNLVGIFAIELLRNWYLVLLFVGMVWALWRLYTMPAKECAKPTSNRQSKVGQIVGFAALQILFLAIAAGASIVGMRGGATKAVRPITVSNANAYAQNPTEAAAVLNTPFALIRTIGKAVFVVPNYFTPAELDAEYSPVHHATNQPKSAATKKNVVILIVESFGSEYIGAMNKTLEEGNYCGYTPFVDSLYAVSTTWEATFSNGRKSIDAMPSILSGIPMFVEPFILTPSSMNDLSGIAGELRKDGYYSAFFHGAANGSMGFGAYAAATGYEDYFGRTEYEADPRFNATADFDGVWAIWDEPYLQHFALKMCEFREPFITTVFTASSHHPFAIPEEYREIYPEGELEIHKCIRYTDNALRRFFDTARRQKWYDNTIFVLTADHVNQSNHAVYQTTVGCYRVPILIFDPSGELAPGVRQGVAQQIDIMPTILSLMGHTHDYVAFGKDMLAESSDNDWAVSYIGGGVYQLLNDKYALQFDGTKVVALYDYREDALLQNNLLDSCDIPLAMERRLKAIIQSYMTRMTTNSLVCRTSQQEP